MKRLAIIGSGGHSKVIAEVAISAGWDTIDFYDDKVTATPITAGHSIQGNVEQLFEKTDLYDGFHVAIGNNRVRLNVLNQLLNLGLSCPSIIEPSSIISKSASIGAGSSVMAKVVVNANTSLGKGVILNTSCSVDHDCKISDGAHISPGSNLAGNVSVGKCSWVGIGSAIIQGMAIGNNSIIGAGSVVIRDIPNDVTVVGNPSRVKR